MSDTEKKGGNLPAILVMFALFFMIAFITNFAGALGPVVKGQFALTNAESQFGSMVNFFAYLFMGIPGGLLLKRKGYKVTAITAVLFGLVGIAIQIASCYLKTKNTCFPTYITGAFIAGFSMCLLNLVVNPLLNTLGGGGNKGNQLVQTGCSLNSIGATIAPVLVGILMGQAAKASGGVATLKDAVPALGIAAAIFVLALVIIGITKIPEPNLETAEEKADRLSGKTSVVADIFATLKFRHFVLGALGIFMYITVESGIPNMALLYMTEETKDAAGAVVKGPGYVGMAVAGSVVGAYWFCMMIGRILGAAFGAKFSSRLQITVCSTAGIALLLAAMFIPVKMVAIPFTSMQIPLSMCFAVLCGLCTSVMWGGIFNMAAEGLGKYVPMGSGIFMTMVFGGLLLPVQGMIADKIGILNSYWLSIGLLAYILFYALVGSRVSKRA